MEEVLLLHHSSGEVGEGGISFHETLSSLKLLLVASGAHSSGY